MSITTGPPSSSYRNTGTDSPSNESKRWSSGSTRPSSASCVSVRRLVSPVAVPHDRPGVAARVRRVVQVAARPGGRAEERLVVVRREQLSLAVHRHEPELVVAAALGQLLDGDEASVR